MADDDKGRTERDSDEREQLSRPIDVDRTRDERQSKSGLACFGSNIKWDGRGSNPRQTA